MDGRLAVPGTSAGALASRIERLEMEERDAVRRRDWSAATSIALERAALKEAHHRRRTPGRRRPKT